MPGFTNMLPKFITGYKKRHSQDNQINPHKEPDRPNSRYGPLLQKHDA
jgi:hypothetical protein